MKTLPFPRSAKRVVRGRRGMTLLELTVAIMVAMLIAAGAMSMLSNQLFFGQYIQRQSFLLHESPQVSNILSRMMFSADSVRLFSSKSNVAITGGAGVTTGARSLLLAFRSPSTGYDYGMIDFDVNGKTLDYYNYDSVSGWPATPSWTISSAAEDVVFSVSNGVVLCTVTGPNGEELTFAGGGQ
ncbi:PulJ/GspJ family protein [Sulfuriroseicoccus oceanibius]|uniref:Prepilin-type N-terminal cleavage/methylation domain-containing protein n=1 Tax=Sulfuriroseicoccus oceanibius TaxID=2707525 RepID=A0A6B3L163_9BACT|nr:hypothetical protein [Sulfuriroseicoccus oceanibius]QQL43742.1 hypothetical protein G3M56_007460 [Sulfuriroseicoccus oceanibius]